MSNLQINTSRLMSRIDALGRLAPPPKGGVRRLALSDDDRAARDQVVAWMQSAGLRVEVDRIGNIFGIRPGTKRHRPS